VVLPDPTLSEGEPSKAPTPTDPAPGEQGAAAPDATEAAPGDAPNDERPPETALVFSWILLFFAGASLGGAIGLLLLPERTDVVTVNALGADPRNRLIKLMAASGAASAVLPSAYLLFRRSRRGIATFERFAKLTAPLSLAFFLPLFFDWRVFQAQDLTFVVVATAFGLVLERTLRIFFDAFPWAPLERLGALARRHLPRAVPRIPAVVAGLGALSFSAYMSFHTVRQHFRLGTMSWDMAIFNNLMWNLIRGEWFKASPVLGPTGSHIQYHATFIAYVLAPFYALYQRPETLLVLQATLAGLAALPLYLVAARRLGTGYGALAFVYAYLVHGPLHGPVFYDFHFITTAPFWIGWVIYFFESNQRLGLVVTWFLALLVREELSASLSMVALVYLLSGRRARWALAGGLLSVVYFVLVKFVVMPMHRTQGPDKETFSWIFIALIAPGEQGLTGVVKTIVSNPIFTLSTLLDSEKLAYTLKTFGPLLLLPLRHRLAWLMFLPAALFTLLTTGYKPVIATSFQYTSYYTPYLFFAAVMAVSAWPVDRVRRLAALWALVVTATVFSFQHGAIFQRHTFRGGFQLVRFELTQQDRKRHKQLYELIAMIPPKASVAATEWEASHVSSRPECYTMRFFTYNAEYLLVNLDEASWGTSRANLLAALGTRKYGFIASRGRFALWGRGAKHDKDAEGARLIGATPAEVGIR